MVLVKMQSQHWANKDLNTIQSYWDSPAAIIRSKWFAEQLKSCQFNSIFEIGFFSGRNLKHVEEVLPEVSINGLEINKKAVEFAKARLPKANLLHMDLHNMHNIKEKYDVIFTSGVLIHVPPDEIPNVLMKCLDLSSKYVMHIETIGKNEVASGPMHLKPTYKVSDQLQWNVDLISVYKNIGFNVNVIKLPDSCKTNGASELIIINRNE
jgi:cyclopropane fatty-acyl-phospholipid synthase-like methyltransferase